jgi:xylulokinase
MFFNIGVGAGKRSLVRSVVEGIGYHNRWQLEAIRKKVPARGPIRFVGGGARSRVTAQVLADILGEEIEIPEDPRNSGALGAAILAVSGLGGISLDENLRSLIPAAIGLTPRSEYAEIYERGYRVFRNLYWRNRKNFAVLNRGR